MKRIKHALSWATIGDFTTSKSEAYSPQPFNTFHECMVRLGYKLTYTQVDPDGFTHHVEPVFEDETN